jgi:methylmalonyl-CoA epimerase
MTTAPAWNDGLVLDHVALVVEDLAAAIDHHVDALGATLDIRRELADQGVDAAALNLPGGGGQIELIAPLGSDSGVARFLQQRGPGLHHVAYGVPDVAAALEAAAARGIRLIDEIPRIGLHGRPVAFLHPSGMYGVLTELIENE